MDKQLDHCTTEGKLEVPMSAMVHIAPGMYNIETVTSMVTLY
jgi:hypothetical protein